jgi:hypothetical protein
MNSTQRRWIGIGIVGLTLATGCGKKDSGGGEPGAGSTRATPTEGGSASGGAQAADGALPPDVMAWLPAGAQAAWDGAWAGRLNIGKSMSMAGNPVAIEIKGATATAFDGKVDHALAFAIVSPCEAAFTEQITEGSMKGGSATYSKLFVMKGDQLVVGSGAAGYRKGKAAIVCSEGSGGGVHVLDDKGTCTTYLDRFGRFERKPTTCTWTQEDGKDVLTIGSGDWAPKVVADGDVLVSGQFTQWVDDKLDTKVADAATARALTLAKIKEKDPLEIAKAAGGKVGETDTVPSLQATFAADEGASLRGKPVEVAGEYMNSNTSISNGVSSYSAVIVANKDATKLTLHCETAAEVTGYAQWDPVTVKGTVETSFGVAGLTGCTIARRKAK